MKNQQKETRKEEVFRAIPGYENYLISNYGRVFSLKRRIYLKNCVRSDGYYKIGLSKEGKTNQPTVHRLVAQAFCEQLEGCDVVNHIDGDILNNYYENLEWTTKKGNNNHGKQTGAYEIYKDKKLIGTYQGAKEVADFLNIASSTVYTKVKIGTPTRTGYIVKRIEKHHLCEAGEN